MFEYYKSTLFLYIAVYSISVPSLTSPQAFLQMHREGDGNWSELKTRISGVFWQVGFYETSTGIWFTTLSGSFPANWFSPSECVPVCVLLDERVGEEEFWFLVTSYHSKHEISVCDVPQPFFSWHSAVLCQYNRNSEAWSCQLPKDSTLWEQVCYGNTHLWTVMRNNTVTGDLKSTVWPHPLYCVQWLFFKILFYVSSGQGFLAEHLAYFSSHDTCKIKTF